MEILKQKLNVVELQNKIQAAIFQRGNCSYNEIEDECFKNAIRESQELNLLFNMIQVRAHEKNYSIVFKFSDTETTDYLGYTDFTKNKIYIELKKSIAQSYFIPVLAHELGEADYLLRNYPIIKREFVEKNNVYARVTEIFSHHHIQSLLKNMGLNYLHNELDACDGSGLLNKYLTLDEITVENIIMVCWAIITYPSVYEARKSILLFQKVDGLSELCDEINRMDTSTVNAKGNIEMLMQKLISLLRKYGLKDDLELAYM